MEESRPRCYIVVVSSCREVSGSVRSTNATHVFGEEVSRLSEESGGENPNERWMKSDQYDPYGVGDQCVTVVRDKGE